MERKRLNIDLSTTTVKDIGHKAIELDVSRKLLIETCLQEAIKNEDFMNIVKKRLKERK